MKIAYRIPLLSVNKAFQGRRFKSPEYCWYEKELLLKLPKKKMIPGYVQVTYKFYVKNFRRDTDNCIKPIQDILVKMGYIEDDSRIIKFTAEKIRSKTERFDIEIRPL